MGLTEELRELKAQAQALIDKVADAEKLEEFRIKFLGAKGAIKQAMQRLKEVPREHKPALGKLANEVQDAVQQMYEQAKEAVARTYTGAGGGTVRTPTASGSGTFTDPVYTDVTLPGTPVTIGRPHILTQTIYEITDVFARMGFDVAYGPEVEDEWHNFIALNIPESHPARDVLENFYITPTMLLRSQTSTIQTRVMEAGGPPVRVIAVGRVYRPDTVDARHSFMFHQVEGLYVDRGVTMADLKTCLDQFCKAYFGHDVRTRLRPSFFPFTEPSAEVDLLFHKADGATQWVEMGGCGMVDPNVLEAVKYDPEEYTGFAFGLGIERMAMRKHGIPDIRLLFENDVRSLAQF